MPLKIISSRDNPDYREALDLARDRRARRHSGRTLLDGPHLLESALETKANIVRLILAETAAMGPLANWVERLSRVPALVVPDRLFAPLSPVESPAGLLSILEIPHPVAPGTNKFVMLLERIQDPGNVGALLRVAAAAGVGAVHLSPGCAEAWSPKCLRGGQGAHFALAIHEGVDLPRFARNFPGTILAARLGAQTSLYDLDLQDEVGFAFGNEGAGLSDALCTVAQPFSIPMPGRAESLNVATAAAVCLFERVRQQNSLVRGRGHDLASPSAA